MVRLERWAVFLHEAPNGGYGPPEAQAQGVCGIATGHPLVADGEQVYSSAIVHICGRTLRTESGREYLLVGEPHVEYLAWLEANGLSYDSDNPLKMSN